jgi:hypothetical protein
MASREASAGDQSHTRIAHSTIRIQFTERDSMRYGRIILAAVLSFAAAGAATAQSGTTPPVTPAATPPVDVVNLDFSKAADQAKMMVNGNAMFTSDGRLELTSDVSQAGSAFATTPVPATTDFLATFQFEVKSLAGAAPADGFAFVAQNVGPDQIGGGGGSLGYAGTTFGATSYAVEFNTYSGNGLGNGQDQTVAWDAFGQREKFDQAAFPDMNGFVDQGVFTAQVQTQPNQLTVTVSGGNNNLKPTVVMKSTDLLAGTNINLYQVLSPKPIFFGFTGGTGGQGAVQDILNLRIQSPAPAATTPAPTAGP